MYLKNDTSHVQQNKDTTIYIKQPVQVKSNVGPLPWQPTSNFDKTVNVNQHAQKASFPVFTWREAVNFLCLGVDRSLFNGVQVALHVTHHVIQCGKDIRHVTSLPISFLPGNEGRERLPSLWSSHGTRDIAGVDVRFEVVRVPPGRWKSYMSMKEKHEPRLKPRIVHSEQYARFG